MLHAYRAGSGELLLLIHGHRGPIGVVRTVAMALIANRPWCIDPAWAAELGRDWRGRRVRAVLRSLGLEDADEDYSG